MSDALKLANEYRPTMPGDVLHSWAVDAVGALHRQADEIERLRAQVAALSAPAPAPAEAALKQARWEGIQSVQIQTAEIVRAALELLDAAGDTFPPERLAAFQRVFGGAAPAAPAGAPAPAEAPTVEAAHAMGATGGTVVEAERLAFEAWMRGHCWALSATWTGTQYRSDAEQGGDLDPRAMATRRLWAAWRDRAALAAPAAPAGCRVTAEDMYTLIGHAEALRMEGETDMPAYLLDLAARIAPDAEHARRVREIAAAPSAPAAPAAAPAPAEAVAIEALAHRIAWRYKQSSDPHHSDTYTFNRATLLQFAAALAAPAAPAGWPEVSELLGEACDMLDLIGCSPEGMSRDLQRASDLQARIRAALAAAPGAQGDA